MNTIRTFLLGGYLAYKGLFHWLNRKLIVPTLLVNPALQLAAFTLIGTYIGSQPPSYYALGNAVHSMARASIFSATVTIAAERTNGTLGTVIGTPSRPLVIFGGRLIPAIVTGFISSVIMIGLATLVAGVEIPMTRLPAVLMMILLVALSCSALGLCLGSVSLYLRDVFFLPNVAIYGMMVLCGVNLTVSETPYAMRVVSEFLPLTHGLRAVRDIVAGREVSTLDPFAELLVACGYAFVAAILLRMFSHQARRGATLDLDA